MAEVYMVETIASSTGVATVTLSSTKRSWCPSPTRPERGRWSSQPSSAWRTPRSDAVRWPAPWRVARSPPPSPPWDSPTITWSATTLPPSRSTWSRSRRSLPEGTRFSVEVNSKFFEAQQHFFVPSPLSKKPKSAGDIVKNGHRVERSPAGLVGTAGKKAISSIYLHMIANKYELISTYRCMYFNKLHFDLLFHYHRNVKQDEIKLSRAIFISQDWSVHIMNSDLMIILFTLVEIFLDTLPLCTKIACPLLTLAFWNGNEFVLTYFTCVSCLSGVIIDDGVVPLPIRFAPKGAGHYPCRVVLRSPNDIRVYQIECSVNPEGTVAQIEFTAPVHQSVPQNIPVVSWSVKYEDNIFTIAFFFKPSFTLIFCCCISWNQSILFYICIYFLKLQWFSKWAFTCWTFILIYTCNDIQCTSFVSNLKFACCWFQGENGRILMSLLCTWQKGTKKYGQALKGNRKDVQNFSTIII